MTFRKKNNRPKEYIFSLVENDVIEKKNEKPDSELPGFSVRMKGLEPSCPCRH